MHERAGSPSISTVQAPHTPCSQPKCVPVSRQCSRRKSPRCVRGCLMLAVQANGCRVETIEGLSDSKELAKLQKAFHEKNALQCGFCTPGMLMAAQDLVRQGKSVTREQIRNHIAGNYCRCTGYQAIVDAIEETIHGQG